MMSEVRESIPYTASGSYYLEYKVLYNGYIQIYSRGKNLNDTKIILINDSSKNVIVANSGIHYQGICAPVYAGQTVNIDSEDYSKITTLNFIYTVGEAKRLGLI